jgi:predicted transcriptional regulator
VVLPRGEEVAEIRPLSRPATVEENLARLQVLGIIERAAAPEGRFEPVAHRPGGLARFLAERD